MRRFLSGVAIGLGLGLAGATFGAQLIGESGYLMGWSVTVNGDTVCDDPFIWPGINEIECD